MKMKQKPVVALARSTSAEEITRLIQEGADVNAVDSRGKTPLIYVAEYSKIPDVLRALIENGADINAVDESGKTPLMHAADRHCDGDIHSNPDALLVLIENGADVAIKVNNYRALDYADENWELKGTDAYKLLRKKTLSKIGATVTHKHT